MAGYHQQPRWPKTTPYAPKGPGPGRWRDKTSAPGAKGEKWAERISGKIGKKRGEKPAPAAPRDYQVRSFADLRVGGQEVSEVEREDRGNLYQVMGQYSRPELNDALADWQEESPIPDLLQAALRNGDKLGPKTYSQFGESKEIDLKRLATDLREAIDQGELTQDAELWRGITLDHETVARDWKPGTERADAGFMAVSMSQEHAEAMLGLRTWEQGSGGGTPYLMRVHAPAGTKAAPGAGAVTELLLKDQTKYRVVSVEPAKANPNPWTGEAEEGWGETPAMITIELI